MQIFYKYFLIFILYSFTGWLMEVVGKLIEKKRFINRGFLIGPVCPIYGHGCILLILLLSKYQKDPLVLFIMSIIICSILEYVTSYILEKLFNVRWWDYSRYKYNINGRICANTMIPFGLLGMLVVYIINPYIMNIVSKVNLNIISPILLTIYLIDCIISTKIMYGFKGTLKTIELDGTEEISKKIKEILKDKNFLYKRLIKAFPNIINQKERIKLLELKIEQEKEKIRKENELRKEKIRNKINERKNQSKK